MVEMINDTVMVRHSRTGDHPPLIVTIPKDIAEFFGLIVGEKLHISCDKRKICMGRYD